MSEGNSVWVVVEGEELPDGSEIRYVARESAVRALTHVSGLWPSHVYRLDAGVAPCVEVSQVAWRARARPGEWF